ncbi:ProQ/FinO family protein [Methylophilus luteus]|uniref:ProQ/FinO family protein n=1 Tax=Methylophilus luteus TaxID=640108 RepID=A0ABW3F994_9PROT
MGFEQLEQLKQSLAKEARATALKAIKTSINVDPVLKDIARLQKLFPIAFPKSPLPKVPLKVGTLDDLVVISKEIGFSADRLKTALHTWCSTRRYWTSVKVGTPRIDLDGKPAGEVQSQEAAHANALYKKSINKD